MFLLGTAARPSYVSILFCSPFQDSTSCWSHLLPLISECKHTDYIPFCHQCSVDNRRAVISVLLSLGCADHSHTGHVAPDHLPSVIIQARISLPCPSLPKALIHQAAPFNPLWKALASSFSFRGRRTSKWASWAVCVCGHIWDAPLCPNWFTGV